LLGDEGSLLGAGGSLLEAEGSLLEAEGSLLEAEGSAASSRLSGVLAGPKPLLIAQPASKITSTNDVNERGRDI
jgi:hypothetical protein